ncbi:unnamed protein product [Moneuplotes crassus]|uniref:Uncharacterized protein n=1 Tax=Euplotes crassus TaxID=5936 RepID=A0AAD2D3X0_EUPCR|nr:unnamed protein product [Moneuplotes crassus]
MIQIRTIIPYTTDHTHLLYLSLRSTCVCSNFHPIPQISLQKSPFHHPPNSL